ncbi:MAG: universal stress protein, partial [Ignavibacteria bacterium]|nr:universal stress protein [Ignavibacteria bacterium]
VDFSANDQRTISQAIAIGKMKSNYLIIHVVESAGAFIFSSESEDEETLDDLAKLKQYAKVLSEKGYNVNVKLGFGRRLKAIKEMTEDFNADLLIMGTHGHGGIKDLIFGETINGIRHKIKIPVLAVK